MFPFADIKREYNFQNEKKVFDKLNELTYNKFWKTLEGDFVNVEPPTFELWYTGDMKNSGKPLATKISVTLLRFNGGVHVKAIASANKIFYLLFTVMIISLIIQLFRSFHLLSVLLDLLIIVGLFIWDYRAKVSALKRLDRVLS